MSFVDGIKSDLNRIRTQPASFQKMFKNMRNTLERFKGKTHPLVKECEAFIDYLGKASAISELMVSTALIKAAEKRLDTIEVLGRLEKESTSALSEYASRYGKGHSVVYELVDDGAQEPEEVLSRLMMHEEDKERFNRKVVFDNNIQYFGVGHRLVDDKHLTVIFFADKIVDLPEKPMNDELIERINRLRTKPTSYVNDFQIMQKIFGRVKKSAFLADDCQKVQELLNNESPKKEIQLSEHLTELAKNFVEGIHKVRKSNLIDVNELVTIAKNFVSGYKFIVGVGCFNIIDPDRIIQNLFVNEFDNNKVIRQTILSQDTKFIGIHFETVSYIPITILAFSDNAEPAELRSFEELAQVRLNEVRTSPNDLIKQLQNYRATLEKSPNKRKVVENIDSLIEELKRVKKLPEFILSKPLCEASAEFLRINGKQTSVFDNRVYAEEKEFLETRLNHYCSGYNQVFQFVHTGTDNVKDAIVMLLVDDRDESQQFRRAVLDATVKYVGSAISEFKRQSLITFILADNVEELKEKQFSDNLFEEINILRRTPKSYIKFFETLLEQTANTQGAKKAAVYKLITFLKNTRFYGAFQRSELLTKAAEARLAFMKEQGSIQKHHSQDDIKVFLSDHCSGYLNVAEIVAQGYENSRDLLSNTLANEDFETGARSYIFNNKLYWVGIAHDVEKNATVVFFADNVEEKKDDGIYVHTHWRKINRPELSEDEILQIRKDFTKLDVLNQGTIFPQHILILIEKNQEFQKTNPVYYNAIKNNANNIQFQQAGMNVDDFIEACKVVVAGFTDDVWKGIFQNFINNNKKKVIDFEIFRNMTKELGYRISDEECLEILKKLTDEKANIDYNKFLEIMKLVESKK